MYSQNDAIGTAKMIRIYSILLIILLSIFTLSACVPAENAGSSEAAKTITDCVGRTVSIPLQVEKAAVLDPFAGESLVMIGAGAKMTAVPNGVQRDKLLAQIYPSLTELPVLASEGTVNAESLLAQSPDVVFLKESIYRSDGEKEKLDKLGIPYLVVGYRNMKEQIYALNMIGQAVGGEYKAKADGINEYYRSVIDLTAQRAKQIPAQDRLRIYHSVNEAVRTDGEDSLGADWIAHMGFTNVSVGANLTMDGSNYYCGMEQIFNWDPDAVICNDKTTMNYLLSDPKWTGLRAVYDNQVYNIPVGATRWGQQGSLETFFAMLWAGTTLYPDYYKDVDLKQEVTSFYHEFLNLDLDDETYQMILSGEGIRTSGQNAGK